MKTLFSGIQPTGDIHLGNYFGAVQNWVKLMESHKSIFCIVDYHAITVNYDISKMREKTLDAVAVNIAAGLDPEKCTIFIQSFVPQHTELAWILSAVTPVGDLFRMTQYKDKSEQNVGNINAGLLTYPVLMAADILLYKAQIVPVGDDQLQHLELAREIVRHFNYRFGEIFPEPQGITGRIKRLRGLDGEAKMSKSKGNTIGLVEDIEMARAKLMKAVTDPARKRRDDPGSPEKCNIYTLHTIISPAETVDWANQGCRSAGIGCTDCKKELFTHLAAIMEPIREKYVELKKRPDYIKDVLNDGANKCTAIAENTMDQVKNALNLTRI